MNGLGNLGINLANYQSQNFDNQVMAGAANTSEAQLDELSKALAAQHITGQGTLDSTTASGSPLKVESLDSTLKLLTFKESEIVIWKKIPKLQAFNTVEEFNQLDSYGVDRGGFILEGELPVEEDSTYIRRAELVKFLGVTKSVTHPMTLINTMIGDAIAREAKNGAMWILRKLDRSLTAADSAIIPEEFNGLYAQHQKAFLASGTLETYHASEVVVDLRGDVLKEKYIERAAEGIIENHGYGTDLFAAPKVLSDFVQNFYGNKFINPNTQQTAAGIMGQRVQEFDSQFGRIALNHDIFMNRLPSKKSNAAATSANAPGVPVIAGAGGTPVASDAESHWAAGDAGDYFYGITALNRFGESTMLTVPATIASIVAGGSIDLSFTDGGGTNVATGYRIYRSNEGAATVGVATFYPLFDISTAQRTAGYDGGAAGVVRDRNRILPQTFQAFMIQNNEEVHAFRQLAPLMKMDLALISTAYRFMVLLYGTPLLFAPKKMVRFINVGVAA